MSIPRTVLPDEPLLYIDTSPIPPSSGSTASPSQVALQPAYNTNPNLFNGLTGGLIAAPGEVQSFSLIAPASGVLTIELNNSAAFSSNRSANTQDNVKRVFRLRLSRTASASTSWTTSAMPSIHRSPSWTGPRGS